MTVAATVRKAGPYAGDGINISFPFAFKVFQKSDVAVVRTDADGAATTLVLDSDYSVLLNLDQDATPGGTVTYPAVVGPPILPVGATLTMIGALAYDQSTDITNVGRFLPQVIENAIDKVTILVQQLKEISGRTLQAAVGTTVSLIFPAPSSGKFIRWRTDLLGLENADAGTDSMALQGLLADNTNNTHGAGMVGFGLGLTYPAGTIGAALTNIGLVVYTIATLRLLLKTGIPRASVLGYYARGDGGGGAYWYDSTDTTTADNGGTVIVAADGGRWKLARTTPLSIRQFGAKGDGVADDLAVFTAAIAALGAGDDLDFPPGIYKVSGTPVMNKPGRLLGAGGALSIIKTSHATLDVLQLTSSNVMVSDIGIETSVVRSGGYFINVVGASNITIDRCPLTGWYAGLGFTGAGGVHIRVRDARIGTTTAGGVGVDIATTGTAMVDGVFEDLLIGGAPGAQPAAAFRILQAGDVALRHISTVYGGTGLAVTPSSGRNVQALYVTDSFFDSGNSNGVELNPQNGCAIQLAKFTNVWSASNGNGFLLNASGTGTVLKSEFVNCVGANNAAGAGLSIAHVNCIDTLVMGGNFPANTNGLQVVAAAVKFKFIGVKSGASGQFGPNSGYGIVMGNNPDLFSIVDCDFNNNTTGPMSFGTLPATGGNTFHIARNQGILTRNSAPVTLNAAATTTVVNHGLPTAPKIEDISITNNGGWGTASSFWITTVTASQFTINTNANPGAGVFVGWRASLWGA